MSTYLSDDDYDFIYSRVPRICVDLLVKNSKGEVLLTQRTIEPYLNHWHFPGGRVKFKESIMDAVERICVAELGVNLVSDAAVKFQGAGGAKHWLPKLVGTCQFPDEIQKGQERHSISLVYEFIVDDYVEFIKAQDKYKWCSEIPEPTIPPQAEFLKANNIL